MTTTDFSKLLDKHVRVVFHEGPESKEKERVWFGMMVGENSDYIELVSSSQTSFVRKQYIVAISEMQRESW